MFKSAERILQLGPEGWVTRIGSISGACGWSEVTAVEETAHAIIITSKNQNALIVPRRALPDNEDWQRLLSDLQIWHRQ